MKVSNNKKATELWAPGSMLFFILFVMAIGFSILLYSVIVNSFGIKILEIPIGVEETILIERFYNSPDCFAYEDESGRAYQKTIDLAKFKNKGIPDKCFSSTNSKYAFKLELDYLGSPEKLFVTTSNWVNFGDSRIELRHVSVYSDNKIKNGKLLIHIQNA